MSVHIIEKLDEIRGVNFTVPDLIGKSESEAAALRLIAESEAENEGADDE